MVIELLGSIPKEVLLNGKYHTEYVDKKGRLKNIRNLKIWKLKDVLSEKYDFSEKDAQEMTNFLIPMLNPDQKQRATATECLKSTWLLTEDK